MSLEYGKLPGVTDVQLVGSLTKAIDPMCEYGDSEGTAVSRLLSCDQTYQMDKSVVSANVVVPQCQHLNWGMRRTA